MNFLLLLSIILTLPLFAQSYKKDLSNLRENCRKELGGYYLSLYDLNEINKNNLTVIKKQLKDLQVQYDKEYTAYIKLKSEEKSKSFDVQLIRQLQNQEIKLQIIRDDIKEKRSMLSSYKNSYDESDKALQDFTKLILPIVQIKNIKTNNTSYIEKSSYNFLIEYLDKCPKYRYICPLPYDKAKLLLKVVYKYPQELASCKKYVHYSGVE